jgi:hypothetical protein
MGTALSSSGDGRIRRGIGFCEKMIANSFCTKILNETQFIEFVPHK